MQEHHIARRRAKNFFHNPGTNAPFPKRSLAMARQRNQIDIGYSGLFKDFHRRPAKTDLMANKKPSIEKSFRESQEILFGGARNVVKNAAIRWNHIEVDDVKENDSPMMGSELVDIVKHFERTFANVQR